MFRSLSLSLLICAGGVVPIHASPTEITYDACRICHDASTGESAIPAIAGQPRDTLLAKMQTFHDGSGDATIMHRFLVGMSADEIDSLAGYISSQESEAQ